LGHLLALQTASGLGLLVATPPEAKLIAQRPLAVSKGWIQNGPSPVADNPSIQSKSPCITIDACHTCAPTASASAQRFQLS